MKRALPLIVAALSGCGAELPAPRIVSISPDGMLASDAVTVTVTVEGALPFHVDYFDSSATTANPAAELRIGAEVFETSGYHADGTITALVPSVFDPGAQDVTVRFSDGRSGTEAGGFEVFPGLWPDTYRFEGTIPDQRVQQPFVVTIRALKTDASNNDVTDTNFGGTVYLTASIGEVTPGITQPFDAGLVTELAVRLTQPGNSVTLTVSDENGTAVSSNPFRVLP